MNYYFAYGSNMNERQMKERCPSARIIGKGFLPGHKLAFTRYSEKRKTAVADILVSPDHSTWGLIYEISNEDLATLDRHEGHPNVYRRFQIAIKQFIESPLDPEEILKLLYEIDLKSYFYDEYNDLNNYKDLEVHSYEVVKKNLNGLSPTLEYLGMLQDAAFEYDFPVAYQNMLHDFGRKERKRLISESLDLFSSLHEIINKGDILKNLGDQEEFGGADLVITGRTERKEQLAQDYPTDLVVLTPHWKELSWLVMKIFHDVTTNWQIDYQNKYWILAELGKAALDYQQEYPNDNDPKNICNAVLIKGYQIFT